MSNESTTTSLAALTHPSLVQPVLIKALSEKSGLYRYARQFDLRMQATAAAKIPIQTAWWGTPADHGALGGFHIRQIGGGHGVGNARLHINPPRFSRDV